MADQTLIIHGYQQLQQGFKLVDKGVRLGLRRELREAVEPVKRAAHVYSQVRIRNMTEPWSQFRIGITQRLVYVAPKQKGRAKRGGNRRLSRPRFGDLLMTKAMEPALADNVQQVETHVWQAIENAVDRAGF